MARTFKLKRGNAADLPVLAEGEPGFTLDTKKLYIGHSDGNVQVSSDENYTSAEKTKLAGITEGANKYTHPTTAGNKHIPTGGSSGQILRYSGSSGTAKWDNETTYSAATTSAAGLMSADDKTKLDGIATGANAYSHPSYTARTGKPTANATPGFGGTFTVSQISSDATGHVTAATDRTVTIPSTAATQSAAGLMSADDKKKLDGVATGANAYSHPTYTAKSSGLYKVTVDGTGHVSATAAVAKADITALGIPSSDTTYSAATTSAAGLMSAADKTKLDGLKNITVDSAMSNSSTNPVQNVVVNSALAQKAAYDHKHNASDITSGTMSTDRLPTIPVTKGGTGATSFSSGQALIGSGNDAVTTRAIQNNLTTTAAISGSQSLVNMNTLRYALNRTTGPETADANYGTLMMRSIKFGVNDLEAGVSALTSGTIYLVYEQ